MGFCLSLKMVLHNSTNTFLRSWLGFWHRCSILTSGFLFDELCCHALQFCVICLPGFSITSTDVFLSVEYVCCLFISLLLFHIAITVVYSVTIAGYYQMLYHHTLDYTSSVLNGLSHHQSNTTSYRYEEQDFVKSFPRSTADPG